MSLGCWKIEVPGCDWYDVELKKKKLELELELLEPELKLLELELKLLELELKLLGHKRSYLFEGCERQIGSNSRS